MKTFKETLELESVDHGYVPNPIPLSDTHNQDRGNLDGLVAAVERQTRRNKQHREIDVEYAVRTGKLRATQSHLHVSGGGDPVFDHLKEPVVAEVDGVGHIMDGHHRLARAYGDGSRVKVHWVQA